VIKGITDGKPPEPVDVATPAPVRLNHNSTVNTDDLKSVATPNFAYCDTPSNPNP
jgi:hypothetical protein